MLACVHYSPETGDVEGIWTLDKNGVPRPTYWEPATKAEFMASLTMMNVVENVCYPRFWEQLTYRAPYWIWWELATFPDGTTPEAALAQLKPLTLLADADR